MIDLPENELFSAYLDGELTAEEQAQVEQLLATSAAARQLMEELRTLSSTLQSLPVQKPQVDLSQRVLRAAERQILSGSDGRSPSGASPLPVEASQLPQPALSSAPVAGRELWKRLVRPRSLLWAAAVFLVAWGLHLLEPSQPHQPPLPQQGGRQIAMGPTERGGEPPSIHAPADKTASPAQKLSEMAAPPADRPPPAAASPKASAMAYLDTEGRPSPAPTANAPPAAPSGPRVSAVQSAQAVPAAPSAPTVPVAPSAPAILATDDGAGMPAGAGWSAAGGQTGGQGRKALADQAALRDKRDEGRLEKKKNAQDAATSLKFGSSNRNPDDSGQAGPDAETQLSRFAGEAPAEAPLVAGTPSHAGKGQAAQPLLVECEVTSQAVHQRLFEKMLAEEQLSGKRLDYRRRGAASRGAPAAKPAAKAAPDKTAGAANGGGRRETGKLDADKGAQVEGLAPSAPTGPAEKRARAAETRSFEVEATAQQLGTIIDWLKARPEDFLSVTATPAVNQLGQQVDQVVAQDVKQEQANKDQLARTDAEDRRTLPQKPGMGAGAMPAPRSPPRATAAKAADRLLEESRRQTLGKSQTDFASPKGGGTGSQQKPQAAAEVTLGMSQEEVAVSQPPPTYRVRFILRVVASEPSAVGRALTDGAAQPAERAGSVEAKSAPAESVLAKPKAADPAPTPAAAPPK